MSGTPGWSRLALGCEALLALAMLCPTAWAQSGSQVAEAKQRFLAATELEAAERWSDAARELERALELKETPGLRFHLAYCQEHLGAYVEALGNYRRAQMLIDQGSPAEDVAELLGPALERAEARVARLEVAFEARPEGMELRVDGRLVEPGEPMELNPGEHSLVVSAPGWLRIERTLSLGAGLARLPLRLRPDVAPSPAASPEPASPPSAFEDRRAESPEPAGVSARTWVMIGESLTLGAALATGIAFALRGDHDQETAELIRGSLGELTATCDDPGSPVAESCAQLRDAERRSDDAALVSTVSFVTAGATAGALILTAWLWPSQRSSRGATRLLPVGPRASWGLSSQFAF
ncbi:MAG: hypothetical protein KC766_36670 [Myxococcales bacterium]|nr:hypothetical protein [Myxococcales bacterium]